MARHAKGPYTLRRVSTGWLVVCADGRLMAGCYSGRLWCSEKVAKGNAERIMELLNKNGVEA